MTFYANLNAAMDYLEAHLDDGLDYQVLAQLTGVSFGTLQRIFPLFAGVSLADYIRRRRLSLAGRDLAQTNARVIDVALKYGYDSTAAFSRAFQKFHGIKPSAVKQTAALKHYPKLVFSAPQLESPIDYELVTLPELKLFGTSIMTDYDHIKHDAPQLFLDVGQKFPELAHPDYGMISYHDTRDACSGYEYWVLWQAPYTSLRPYTVPASRWLKLHIPSQEATDIQRVSDKFYENFLPTCTYQLKPDPELEYYHDGVTEFLIPIF